MGNEKFEKVVFLENSKWRNWGLYFYFTTWNLQHYQFSPIPKTKQISGLNWLYAKLHYFLNLSQLLVSCLPLLDKLI